MLRSLFSGISGLRAHQQMMDVTGNNIANVNTTGFKSSQSTFQDTLSQMVRSAGSPQGDAGGTNPAQIGLGVRLAGISTNFGQGSAQTTGKSTDLMIQGDGFFVVRSGGENLYTRAGAFDFDGSGNLVTSGGQVVQGWMAENGTLLPNVGDIRLPMGQTVAPTATTQMTLAGNLSVDATPAPTVELATTAYNATGGTETVRLQFTRTAADPTATPPTATWEISRVGSGDAPVSVDFTNGRPPAGTIDVGPYQVNIDSLTSFAGASAPKVSDSNGSAAGTLSSYTISQTGEIIGVFSSGLKQTLGQIALANFNNVNGLEKTGESMFRTTVNSGLPQIGVAGAGGLGQMANGILEMSNVDLAAEFTNLVIAQRGFQANSRVITTSDELLQELVNLKR